MALLNFKEVDLSKLISHQIGNKHQEEGFSLSSEDTETMPGTDTYLKRYFLQGFLNEEFYTFEHPVELSNNPTYAMAKKLFASQEDFIPESQKIAEMLYNASAHPQIRNGVLNVAYFKELIFGDEVVDAIGIFKSESTVPFLKMNEENAQFSIEHQYGFEIKGLDKACLILNVGEEDGYRVLIVDHKNKAEAQYWTQDFLQLSIVDNEYMQTSRFMGVTKDFLTKAVSSEFDLNRADQIDLLNKSAEYFKKNDEFIRNEFEEEVFQAPELIDSFRRFENSAATEQNIQPATEFQISENAVKKQSKIFKSILKLDKNFHVYIHGDREKIEYGVDDDGRKFYKLYFQEES